MAVSSSCTGWTWPHGGSRSNPSNPPRNRWSASARPARGRCWSVSNSAGTSTETTHCKAGASVAPGKRSSRWLSHTTPRAPQCWMIQARPSFCSRGPTATATAPSCCSANMAITKLGWLLWYRTTRSPGCRPSFKNPLAAQAERSASSRQVQRCASKTIAKRSPWRATVASSMACRLPHRSGKHGSTRSPKWASRRRAGT